MPLSVAVLPTMDCEPPMTEVSEHANRMSGSAPDDYEESERAITGYVAMADEHGFTPTLFVHPKVAENQTELLRYLQDRGVCLGLHLHPYKLERTYRHDLGAYPADEQRRILEEATDRWERAIGRHPRYFRPGVFSANDCTFALLEDLGYVGGSVSSPGRVNVSSAAVWTGAQIDPHRAHSGFRQRAGELDFVNVPMSVDRTTPTEAAHHGGRQSYESLYLSAVDEEPINPDASGYDLLTVLGNVLDRLAEERPAVPTVLTNTHNNMDYFDPDHPATQNFRTILSAVTDECQARGLVPRKATLETVVKTASKQL